MAECSGNFAPWACATIEDQQTPQCLTACTGDADCKSGFTCNASNCVDLLGLGDACTGAPGQGSCLAGLKCDNAVCCDGTGPTCCNVTADCAGNLACNTVVSACFDACNAYDDTRCADPATQYCFANACVPKSADGQACADNGACLSAYCVEGVCCNSACAGTCESCRSGLSGQAEGTCATIQVGSQDNAPTNLCTAGGQGCTGGSCACDGDGATPGNCKPAVGQDCSADLECASGFCECADTQCSASKCSASRCGLCEYNATGIMCLAGLGDPGPVDDPQDCTGMSSCYAGLCSLDTGQACTTDAACGLGHCECGDATCTAGGTLCADMTCGPCKFTSSGTACDGDRAAATSCDDGDACTTTDGCSGGVCVGSDPVACVTPPGECYVTNGLCEPADGSCSYGVKAAGSPCNDGDVCTATDGCSGGLCVGSDPIVTCTLGDGCCPGGCTEANDDDCAGPLDPCGLPFSHCIFVLNGGTADKGGLSGADDSCQAAAVAAAMSGNYKVILSTSTINAADRITISAPVHMVDGSVIADDAAQFWSTGHYLAINLTETGQASALRTATGTNENGLRDTGDGQCADWTSTSSANGWTACLNRNTSDGTVLWANNYSCGCWSAPGSYCIQQ